MGALPLLTICLAAKHIPEAFVMQLCLLIPVGIALGCLGGFLLSRAKTCALYLTRTTKTHAWIVGVNKEYLAALPSWPEH